MRFAPRSERSWLAFRYVSGDLTPAELDAFERRLAHDQGAREAVAEAVELASAVAALPPSAFETVPIRQRPSYRFAALAAALAAGLLLAVGLHWRSSVPDGTQVAGRKSSQTRALALLWSGLHEENNAGIGGSDDLLAWLDESSRPADAEIVAASDPSDAVPSWLWEAASLPQPDGPSAPETREN